MLILGGLFLVASSVVTIAAAKLFLPEEFQNTGFLLATIKSGTLSASVANGLLILQGFSAISGFILAPIIYLFAFDKALLYKIRQIQPWKWWHIALVFLLAISVQPIIDFTYQLNQQLVLPSFLSDWEKLIRESEEQMQTLTKAIAMPQDGLGWILAVIVIGIIPGIGEELLFRGIIQSLFIRAKVNFHLSIWISAILFSLLHFQMYGFLPRAIMGAMFGYIYYYSGILPLAILAHSINNLLVLQVVNITGDLDTTTSNSWIYAILVIPVIYLAIKKLIPPSHDQVKKTQEGWAKVYTTTLNIRAEYVASLLDKSGIQAMVINKVDSSFHFGEFQVFVHNHQESLARVVIQNDVSFE